MADQSQIPDRRPIIYGLLAVLVLLAATALFWPSSDSESPDTLILTPESLQAASDSTPTENPGTVAGGTETVREEDLAATPLPRGETEIVGATPGSGAPTNEIRVEGTQAAPGSQTRAPRPQPLPSSAIPTGVSTEVRPAAEGDYVLNVGSFQERPNADAMVLDLQKKGVPAQVRSATSKGATVYRVRVGFFATSGEAATYAQDLKRDLGIDAWTSHR